MSAAFVACHSSATPAGPALTSVSATHRRTPFVLGPMHCGIQSVSIDGGLWEADHRLPGDGVNPPPGWNARGTLIFIDESTVKFESSSGSVVYRRTGRRYPGCL
jgi:hypothetical protein